MAEEVREYCGICDKDYSPEEYDEHMITHTETYQREMEEWELGFELWVLYH